jgi:hypothetical protein
MRLGLLFPFLFTDYHSEFMHRDKAFRVLGYKADTTIGYSAEKNIVNDYSHASAEKNIVNDYSHAFLES